MSKTPNFNSSPPKFIQESFKQTSRSCVKVKQYKYQPENIAQKQQKSEKTHIPIRAILKKLQLAPQLSQFDEKDKIKMIMSQLQLYSQRKSNVDMTYKKFITPRDTKYNPKPFMFDRYNYENYGNYRYKNPYKPAKYPIVNNMIKGPSRSVKSGTTKNLQIVFCEKKFQDFVEKTNKQINQYYLTSRSKSISNLPKPVINNYKTYRSNSKEKQKREQYRPKIKKSNLANYLQQFTTLQKLSQYMERQHKLNEKFLFSPSYDKSNTVLIEILVHRFQFLKKLKKRCLQLIFRILLNLDQLPKYYKINIQDYLKFVQLFVYRDAESFMTSMFIFSFLFKQSQQISINAAKKSLDLLGGSASLHLEIENQIENMIEEYPQDGESIFQAIKNDERFQKMFIDLILMP